MSYEAFNMALETHINSNYAETPVQYENAPAPDVATDQEWVSISVQFGGAEPRTMGSVQESHETGIAFAQIFIPSGGGSKRAREIADVIIPLLSNRFIGDAYFYQASISDVGTRANEGYYQLNILAPFFRRIS